MSAQRIAPEAAQAYLKGRHEFYRFTEAGLWAAIDWYEKAIQADANFALAYSAMANAYSMMVVPLATFPPRELFGKVEAAARKALSIDASNVEAHWVLGMTEIMFHWNWKAGERETRMALELDPNNANARLILAMYYIMVGDGSRCLEQAEQACLLDPFSPFMQSTYLAVLYHARQFVELRKRAVADRPRLKGFFKYHLILGACEIHDQRWESAIEELEIAVAASGGSSFMKVYLGYALAGSGREAEARAIFQELLVLAESRYIPATDFAILAVGLGNINEALDWLEKAYEERSTYLMFLTHEALFDPLRTELRFQDIVQRIGLSSASPEAPPEFNPSIVN